MKEPEVGALITASTAAAATGNMTTSEKDSNKLTAAQEELAERYGMM